MALIGRAHYVEYEKDGVTNQIIHTFDHFVITRQVRHPGERRAWRVRADAEAFYNQVTLLLHNTQWKKVRAVDVDYTTDDRESNLNGTPSAPLVRRINQTLGV